jgi:hypothetical protein
MITDSYKLEHVQRKSAALCHNEFFRDMQYHYDNLLERLNLLTLHNIRLIDALFLVNVFIGTKCLPSVHEIVRLLAPIRNIRNFTGSLALLAAALQLDAFQPQMRYINLPIFLGTHV